jgi:hypothetical protein
VRALKIVVLPEEGKPIIPSFIIVWKLREMRSQALPSMMGDLFE